MMMLVRRFRPKRVLSVGVIVVVLALVAAVAFAADERLRARLDPETAAAVEEIIEGARHKGLPVEPLVARALEGASRQAPAARIVAGVRSLAADLETARDVLGPGSSSAELVAGATALSAGVRADTLSRLRIARPQGSLVVPLVVLTDLVTRRVPVETASAAVVAATRAQVRDRTMKLRQRIDRDIRSGASPGSATIARTRSLVRTFEPPATPGRVPAGGAGSEKRGP